MRILIIDDEPDIRGFLEKGLKLHRPSVEVIEASNGMEAVRIVSTDCPDAILLDMLMPDMDGWEFLQILDALKSSVPVVILTAVHRDNASLFGLIGSYQDVLAIFNKPIGIHQLGEILDAFDEVRGFPGTGGQEPSV